MLTKVKFHQGKIIVNIVSKIICETIARKTLVSPDAYPDLEDLFRMISDEDK